MSIDPTWQNALVGLLGAASALFSVRAERARRSLNGHSASLNRTIAKLELQEDRIILLEESNLNLLSRVRTLESWKARST